jgi:aromatic-amino-acid transaminase
MSFFENVSLAPSDPILGLNAAFIADTRAGKINLTAGVYKTEEGITPIMSAVKKMETILLQDSESKQYLPIDGDKTYLDQVGQLVFGQSFWQKNLTCISSFQSIGGTGALRIAGEFLKKEVGSQIYISEPSWPNHKGVFSQAGLSIETYPYYDMKTNSMEFEKMATCLRTLPAKTVVLFHACCHNPSGLDPTLLQWEMLAEICKERELIPFFDAAYLGLDQGIDADSSALRLFAAKGLEMLVAVSFSKNFSLYGERVGALYIVSSTKEIAEKVTSQVKILIRRNYSNPPIHGAKIVAGILLDPDLRHSWETELSEMRQRILALKMSFCEKLSNEIKTKDFGYLAKTRGMFCFCGLEKPVVERLMTEYGIYMTYDGRINVAGLTVKSIDYVVQSIACGLKS